MRDVKPKQDEELTVSSGPGKPLKKQKPEPIYPRVRIELDTLPEAKKWEVGDLYEIRMQVRMVGLSISRYDNSADFEIRKIGVESESDDDAEEADEYDGDDDGD